MNEPSLEANAMFPNAIFTNPAITMMGGVSALAAQSLINLIEMISTNSHNYVQQNKDFSALALSLMQQAALTKNPAELADLQKKWAQSCVTYGQDQTRASLDFIEQCGKQALKLAAKSARQPQDEKAPEDVVPPQDEEAPKENVASKENLAPAATKAIHVKPTKPTIKQTKVTK